LFFFSLLFSHSLWVVVYQFPSFSFSAASFFFVCPLFFDVGKAIISSLSFLKLAGSFCFFGLFSSLFGRYPQKFLSRSVPLYPFILSPFWIFSFQFFPPHPPHMMLSSWHYLPYIPPSMPPSFIFFYSPFNFPPFCIPPTNYTDTIRPEPSIFCPWCLPFLLPPSLFFSFYYFFCPTKQLFFAFPSS